MIFCVRDDKQLEHGVCKKKRCLVPTPCKNLRADHKEYVKLLKEVESLDGVKKVFIRSGIRFDYLMCDKDNSFFKKLVRDHVSGQLKVAPEHCSSRVLHHMGKPDISVYDRFRDKFFDYSAECGLEQYLVPYLMSSHPGSTLEDAVELALYTKKIGLNPEQVQDFYPTPGTASTVMYYTGLDPFSMEEIYTPTDYHEKQLQRALLQYRKPQMHSLCREALRKCGREDLIGVLVPHGGDSKMGKSRHNSSENKNGSHDRNPADRVRYTGGNRKGEKSTRDNRDGARKVENKPTSSKPKKKDGWAKAAPKKNTRPGAKKFAGKKK